MNSAALFSSVQKIFSSHLAVAQMTFGQKSGEVSCFIPALQVGKLRHGMET